MVVVAQFAGTHGVRGEFKIRSFTEDPEAVFAYGPLSTPDGSKLRPTKLRETKPSVFLCKDADIQSPEACAEYKGGLLSVPRDVLPMGDEDDDFYISDLVGLEARDETGAVLGRVRAVPNYGAGDIVEVSGKGGFVLVPFTKDAVPEVNLDEGFITIVPPEDEDPPKDD